MTQWYYFVDGQRHGPVDSRMLRRLADDGLLFPSHKVWREGLPTAVPAMRIRGLFRSIEPPPPRRAGRGRGPGRAAASGNDSPIRPADPAPSPARPAPDQASHTAEPRAAG